MRPTFSLHAILFFVAFIGFISLTAQGISYIYLEGIQTIPFKVIFNQEEKPTLGKNYYLLPTTKNGEYVIEIECNGNIFLKETFIIDVRENSSYGYKLARAGDEKYYSLDLFNISKKSEINSKIIMYIKND